MVIALTIGSSFLLNAAAESWSAVLPKLQDDPNSGLIIKTNDVKWLGKVHLYFTCIFLNPLL